MPAGEFVAIVGGSGSGKTTTLKTINRLIEPDSGDVHVDGEPTRSCRGTSCGGASATCSRASACSRT